MTTGNDPRMHKGIPPSTSEFSKESDASRLRQEDPPRRAYSSNLEKARMRPLDSHIAPPSDDLQPYAEGIVSNAAPAADTTIRPLSIQRPPSGDAPWITNGPRLPKQNTAMTVFMPPSIRQATSNKTVDDAKSRAGAFLKLNNASTKFQTGVTQMQVASRGFTSQRYLDGFHAAISGIGNMIDAGGDALSGAADLAKLQGNTPFGQMLETGANYLNSTGSPLKSLGDIFKDLDSAMKTFSDPTTTPQEKNLAFRGALSTIMRETGDTVTTLNETTGSANAFVAALGETLATAGNIGRGTTGIRQNVHNFLTSLHEGNIHHAATAGVGSLAGTYFLMGGIGQAIGKALKSTGYAELGERVSNYAEYTANYGEKAEALQDLLESM